MNRYKIREITFKLLFKLDFYKPEEFDEQLSNYFESLSSEGMTQEEKILLTENVKSIYEHIEQIDDQIKTHSVGWKIERLGKVEKAILRLAIYEINFDEKIPQAVAINEAVNLVKKFGDPKAKGFVNGILGSLSRES